MVRNTTIATGPTRESVILTERGRVAPENGNRENYMAESIYLAPLRIRTPGLDPIFFEPEGQCEQDALNP